MREGASRTPRHGEHHVERYTKCLGTVNMREARRISDDGVGDERALRGWVWSNARSPEASQHFTHHLTLAAYVASSKALERWNETWVLDHVLDEKDKVSSRLIRLLQKGWTMGETYGHQIFWVSTDREELQSRFAHEICKHIMRCQSNAMPILLQSNTESKEWLNVA